MERVERRLAAILAADVAGYSRLIGADEEGTLARLKAHRRELIDPKIGEHKGRIVKTTGDGLLVEFGSVIDALRCATEIQTGIAERTTLSPSDRQIEFRIGIHQGDVVVEDGDIFGDGVNVAARLEALAEPGGICVSARVQEDAAGKLDLAFEDLGDQALKNIARPVRAYRVATASASPTALEAPALTLPDKPSIAVLPFQNISGDPEQEVFANGMVEDITTALSKLRWFFVIARNSSFAYKGRAIGVKQVGRELGVRYVLEGSVRKGGNRLRHSAAGRGRNRQSRVGRALRPRPPRYLRSAGRDHRAGGRGYRARTLCRREYSQPAQATGKPGCLGMRNPGFVRDEPGHTGGDCQSREAVSASHRDGA